MCLVFVLLFLCVLIPTWIKTNRRDRNRARLQTRIEGLGGLDPEKKRRGEAFLNE